MTVTGICLHPFRGAIVIACTGATSVDGVTVELLFSAMDRRLGGLRKAGRSAEFAGRCALMSVRRSRELRALSPVPVWEPPAECLQPARWR